MKLSRVEVRFDKDSTDYFGIEIPPYLEKAVQSRKLQFAAGRHCAFQAMDYLGIQHNRNLPSKPQGGPEWPQGAIGSITHTKTYAKALVMALEGNPTQSIGVGIDSELLMEESIATKTSRKILINIERQRFDQKFHQFLDFATYVTAIFCAKESIFKALSPIADVKIFGFEAADITDIDLAGSRFNALLLKDLGPLLRMGTPLSGWIQLAPDMVHTELFFSPTSDHSTL